MSAFSQEVTNLKGHKYLKRFSSSKFVIFNCLPEQSSDQSVQNKSIQDYQTKTINRQTIKTNCWPNLAFRENRYWFWGWYYVWYYSRGGFYHFGCGDEINSNPNFPLRPVFYFSITRLINDIFRSNLGPNHSLDGTAQGLHTDGTVTLAPSDLHTVHIGAHLGTPKYNRAHLGTLGCTGIMGPAHWWNSHTWTFTLCTLVYTWAHWITLRWAHWNNSWKACTVHSAQCTPRYTDGKSHIGILGPDSLSKSKTPCYEIVYKRWI